LVLLVIISLIILLLIIVFLLFFLARRRSRKKKQVLGALEQAVLNELGETNQAEKIQQDFNEAEKDLE